MFREDELLPISALQHHVYCPRRCGLIHLERIWAENLLTAEGRIIHERVNIPGAENRRRVLTEFSLPLRSLRLGVAGVADLVEFYSPPPGSPDGRKIPYPVEYKRGDAGDEEPYKVQLCAQALCLEEMLGVNVPEGAFYFERKRRRIPVLFSDELRQKTAETAERLHAMFASGRTPAPEFGRKCKPCSLRDDCLPRVCGKRATVARYLASIMEEP